MSHFTRVKTRIFDLAAAEATAKQLNFRISPIKVVNGWQGATCTKVDLVLKTSGPYDIGLQKQADGSYSFTGDWWGIRTTTGLDQERFVNSFMQAYALNVVKTQAAAQGFAIGEQAKERDGSVYLCLQRR